MTPSEISRTGDRPAGGLLYFFLSYARLGPEDPAEPSEAHDEVGAFFRKLAAEVAARSGAEAEQVGFYDGQVSYPADLRAALAEALGRAQVFIALYSPGYLDFSWTRREQAAFRQRLTEEELDPEAHILPLLWTPVPPWVGTPEERHALDQARRLDLGTPEYAAEGLRALSVLRPYARAFEEVVHRLADLIVAMVRDAVVPDSGPLTLGAIGDIPAGDPSFTLATLEPSVHLHRTDSVWHRSPGRQRPAIMEYAMRTAERLGFSPQDVLPGQIGEASATNPVVVFVDPELLGQEGGAEGLRALFEELPLWVHPLIVTETAISADRVARTRAVLEGALPPDATGTHRRVHVVAAPEGLDGVLPTVLARARKAYLQQGPFPGLPASVQRQQLRRPGGQETSRGDGHVDE